MIAAMAGWAYADSYTATGDYFNEDDAPREGTYSPPIEETDLGVFEGGAQLTVNFNGWGLAPPDYLYWEIEVDLTSDIDAFDEYSPEYTGHGIPDVLHTFTRPGGYRVVLAYFNDDSEPVARYHARYRISNRQQLFDWDDDRWDQDYLESEWNTVYYGESWGGGSAFETAGFTPDTGNSNTKGMPAPFLVPALSVEVTGNGPWYAACSATGSSPAGEIVLYEWDLDHDGSFNMDTGRNPVLEQRLKHRGRYIFTLRVTDMRGRSATVDAEFTIGAG